MNVLKNFFIGVDQTINTIVSIGDDGYGTIDEMLSARAWRLKDESSLYRWIDKLFFWDANHCEECYKIEQERLQLPPEYRLKSKEIL